MEWEGGAFWEHFIFVSVIIYVDTPCGRAFVWGLVGHCSIFGDLSPYLNVNRFFLGGGTIDPLLVWFSHKAFPEKAIDKPNPTRIFFASVMIMQFFSPHLWLLQGE